MKKRILSMLLLAVLLCGLLAQNTPAARALPGEPQPQGSIVGSCGEELLWQFFPGSGLLSIGGRGSMYDYDIGESPWYPYATEITSLELPERLDYIGEFAFYNLQSLESVTIPDQVEAIGIGAFSDCSSLRTVNLPDSLLHLRNSCFCNTALRSIILPRNLENIDANAFSECSNLRIVALRNPFTRIAAKIYEYDPSQNHWMGFDLDGFGDPNKVSLIGKHDDSVMNVPSVMLEVSDYVKLEYMYVEPYADMLFFNYMALDPFHDIPEGKYYEIPVAWASGTGITGGTGGGKFSPSKTCTREQVVTFLYAAMGKPGHHVKENPFSDVKSSKYYYNAVMWAYENKIASGVGGGKFGVGKPCTRAQIMTFLWKAVGSPKSSIDSLPFTDVDPNKYYYDAIKWAYESKITGGVSATKFGVSKSCTRAQMVTFLYGAYLLDYLPAVY